MGNFCSKCFKKEDLKISTAKQKDSINQDTAKNMQFITNSNLNVNSNLNNPISSISIKRNEDLKVVEYINVEENKEQNFNFSKKEEESKEKRNQDTLSKRSSSKITFHDYFDAKELIYYQKLYETEEYDIINPKKITRFQKGELIGEGSFGRVYQGFDGDEGQIIAIKEIDMNKINGKNLEKIKSFEQEIEILSKLHNKNIIKYYGTCRTKDNLNIFLEYCIGGSIAKMLEIYGKFKENLIKKYTKQILEGLEYLHAHNIIHRDIKGANILVDKEGICKLSDFGGSKIIREEIEMDKQNSFKGTPHWMAPETIKFLETTRYSDIWSLGCTVIEMATGEPPWAEYRSPVSALYNILKADKPPQFPSFISNDMKSFLSHCMKMVPNERLNVYKLLRHPFITGDTIFIYETKRFSSSHNKTFSSENLQKSGVDLKKKNHSLLNAKDGKSSEDIKTEEIHISQINPIVHSFEKKTNVKFESTQIKNEKKKNLIRNHIKNEQIDAIIKPA